MKHLHIALFLICATFNSFAQDDFELVNGKIKSLKIQQFTASLDSAGNLVVGPQKSGYKGSIYIINNENGNELVKYSDYDHEAKTSYMARHTKYNKQGLKDSTYTWFREKTAADGFTRYKYDNNGNMLKREYFFDNKRVKHTNDNTYNSEGQLISSTTLTWKRLSDKYTHTYDSKGNKTSTIHTSIAYDKSEKQDKTYWEYDNNGNLIKETHHHLGGKHISYEEFEYNNKNQKIKRCAYDDGNAECSGVFEWVYDEHGNVIEKKWYAYYDKEGWQVSGFSISSKTHERKINISKNVYKYDSMNNWIEKIEYSNEEPIMIIKREIEY